jgi:hypothetical protein
VIDESRQDGRAPRAGSPDAQARSIEALVPRPVRSIGARGAPFLGSALTALVAALASVLAGCCVLPSSSTGGPSPPPGARRPPPSRPEEPIGSPGFCPGDDRTGVPLATSTFASTLDLATARAALDARNEICGDTWCEGSFEWFAYDLRGDAMRSEMTLRTYSYQEPPTADVSSIVVTGPQYVGRVLARHDVPACTTPCGGFAEPPLWAPCMVLDVRCELELPASDDMAWEEALIACGGALEMAVRERVPESFAPE